MLHQKLGGIDHAGDAARLCFFTDTKQKKGHSHTMFQEELLQDREAYNKTVHAILKTFRGTIIEAHFDRTYPSTNTL